MAMYKAEQVADFILSLASPDENDISNLKLQKLCYYCQGLITSMRGEPLFSDDICAWDHGPVVPNLYHKFKEYGAQPINIPVDFDVNQIDPKDRRAIIDVCEYYGQYSPWRLRNMTHEEKPWIDAYKAQSGRKIPLEDLVSYFKPQLDEEYVGSLYGEAKA